MLMVRRLMFWQAPRLIARVGAARLFGWCIAIGAVSWSVPALYADSFAIMFAAQLTHAFLFAAFHSCLLQLIPHFFPCVLPAS